MVKTVPDDSHIRTSDCTSSSLSPPSLLLYHFLLLPLQMPWDCVSRGYTGTLATSIIPAFLERRQALLRT